MYRVLVVEDNHDIRVILERFLRTTGYVVLTATNGYEGVAIAVAQQPDLILIDLALPGMDGLAAVRRLRSDQATAHIPVVGMSGFDIYAENRARANGCNGFVAKPFDFRQLMLQIERFLPPQSANDGAEMQNRSR